MPTLAAACLVLCNTSIAESYEEKVQASLSAIGQPIAAIDFISLDGQPRAFNALVGKPSVVYFFASWCAPCYKTLHDIEQIRQQQKVSVTLVAIALDEDSTAVAEMIKQTGFTGETWLANSGAKPLKKRLFANAYKVLPYVVQLDSDLVLVDHSYDIKSLSQWQAVLVNGEQLSQASVGK
ncbi:TlpA family protein disulfide reductase [Thalassotalea euphylliae]|uniref:TlpA family protein disulfide reductase n=2 Tax=Thalassotalea euphylliae TaxID=1655234 RepID=A0A3E0TWD7_9GAMM|nr:TlpA family protein disulfide reductase [Thalassotalea euphylliae]